jgi:formylglycine-generating enzyme required for sulfatase activity
VTAPARDEVVSETRRKRQTIDKREQRGGSFLCCDNYCVRYMMGGQGKGEPESTANHLGFRCVKAAK